MTSVIVRHCRSGLKIIIIIDDKKKLYNFEINASNGAKELITNKLKALITEGNKLKVRPQTKLKILKRYIHSQLVFYLKAYDLPSTWIENALDALCVQYVRD